MSKDDKIVPIKQPQGELEHICEVGGNFDETRVVLYAYSEKLNKDEVSKLLEVSATKSWNPNEPHYVGNKKERIITKPFGKWWLESDSNDSDVVEKIRTLLAQCTENLESWSELTSKYECWLSIVGHLDNWNRELNLPVDIMKLMVDRNLDLNIDVYFDGDEE